LAIKKKATGGPSFHPLSSQGGTCGEGLDWVPEKTLVLRYLRGNCHHHSGGPSRHTEQQHSGYLNKLLPANVDVLSTCLKSTVGHYIDHQSAMFLLAF